MHDLRRIKNDLKESSEENLIRYAKWLGLRKDLDILGKKNLIKLIIWKLRKENQNYW